MKIIVVSDMDMAIVWSVVEELRRMGHEVTLHGALVRTPAPWSRVAIEAAAKISEGLFDQGVFFCWTGTGISMAANKVKGIRAALCTDAETARGARVWNDANVLCMSLRLTSEVIAREMLEAWFAAQPSTEEEDAACIAFLKEAEGVKSE